MHMCFRSLNSTSLITLGGAGGSIWRETSHVPRSYGQIVRAFFHGSLGLMMRSETRNLT